MKVKNKRERNVFNHCLPHFLIFFSPLFPDMVSSPPSATCRTILPSSLSSFTQRSPSLPLILFCFSSLALRSSMRVLASLVTYLRCSRDEVQCVVSLGLIQLVITQTTTTEICSTNWILTLGHLPKLPESLFSSFSLCEAY